MKLTKTFASAMALTIGLSAAASAEDVEVLHWWTAGGEAAALNVLKEDLAKQGIGWLDMPVAGGAGDAAMTALSARVTSGNPPTAVQLLGFDLRDWSAQGVFGNLNAVAEAEGWDAVIPAALQDFSKFEGNWVAAPVNMHSTNWLWISKAALEKTGLGEPTNFDELIAVLDKMKENGITPLAHGGQPWQDATVLEAIILAEGGDFYKKAFNELDAETLGSAQMAGVFDKFIKLRGYMDDNFSGRDWNLASAMVINGEAGMQAMGDWAKGEFIKAGMTPGEDFLCIRFPGTQGSMTFNADQFAMFDVDGEEKVKAQHAMAKAIEGLEFQSAFNVVKGSVPARTDVPDTAFDACGKKGMKDLVEANAAGTLYGSMAHGYGAQASVKNAVFDIATAAINGEYTDGASAAAALAQAVASAQ